MKNLLTFSAFLAAGFLLGSRRARKSGPAEQLRIEVNVETSQAVGALKELQAQATKTAQVVFSGADVAAMLRREHYQRSYTPDSGRATGQTTRLVDAAIQTLFTEGEVKVRDHVDRRANHQIAYEILVARLKSEHGRERLVFDAPRLTVRLVKHARKNFPGLA